MDAVAVGTFLGLVRDEAMSEAEALFCWVDAVKIASAWLTKFQSDIWFGSVGLRHIAEIRFDDLSAR